MAKKEDGFLVLDLLQIATKLAIIAALVFIAVLASVRVWRADLDLAKLFSPRRAVESSVDEKLSWLPTRESNGLYQNGQLVARVEGAVVDEPQRIAQFAEIFQAHNLNLETDFEFQKWRLKFRSAEMLIGLDASAPHKGRMILKAVCEIVGFRNPL